jgi:hypothetical protein
MSSQNYRVELAVQARSTIGEGPVWHAEKVSLGDEKQYELHSIIAAAAVLG